RDNNLRSRGRRAPPPAPGPSPTPGPGCLGLASPPVASLRTEALTRVTGEPDLVELDGSASAARVGALVRYRFESGDRRIEDGAASSVRFVYAPGDYVARLTVFDDRGACGVATRSYSEK